jgi:hypothetical protein
MILLMKDQEGEILSTMKEKKESIVPEISLQKNNKLQPM